MSFNQKMNKLNNKFNKGITELALHVESQQQKKLFSYLDLLDKWNQVFNLTAVRDREQMITHHLLDSLSVLPYLCDRKRREKPRRFLDVGSGAGLPGIPLAVAMPETEFFLLDSNGKKTRFLIQAKQELGLSNVTVINSRLEQFKPDFLFSDLICRAFSDLSSWVTKSKHLTDQHTRFWAMKGHYPTKEIEALPKTVKLQQAIPLTVPFLEKERYLLRLGLIVG